LIVLDGAISCETSFSRAFVMSDPSAEKKVQDAAFVLVGEFMFHWSFIESKITDGIQSLLTLETPQAEIILAKLRR
jgi:hypothetical protein